MLSALGARKVIRMTRRSGASNTNMHRARAAKNDEFYTRLEDIEREMVYYKPHFKGKIVYCNCDDPKESQFWNYFYLCYEHLGLAGLISTHYTKDGSPSYSLEYDGSTVTETALEGDGDFRSEESIALLKQADIVVTNPPFSCYSDDTEVRTHRGWKLFKDVLEDDLIMSLNLETNTQEWVPFTERIQYRVDGELLLFKNRRKNLLVTKDHRMIVKRGYTNRAGNYYDPVATEKGIESLIPASNIRPSNILPVRGFDWVGEDCSHFILPETEQLEQYTLKKIKVEKKIIDMGDWLEFFGMWLADGSVRRGYNTQGNPRYTVSIKQNESNEQYIKRLYDNIGFPCKVERSKTGNHNYVVYSKQLWEYLNQFGRSRDKCIPEEFLNLTKPLLSRLWTGYINGDGFAQGIYHVLSSVSKPLMEGIQDLMLRLFGRVQQILKVNATYRGRPYIYYELAYSKGSKVWGSRYGKPETIKYCGDVFCLTLKRNGTMLVRRGGTISWSGNCFRDYTAQLIEHEKQFLIIGNMNAITYKEIFPLIKENKLWLGVSPRSMKFILPDGTEKAVNAVWYTNLTHRKRNEELFLYRKYADDPAYYPKYDNYDAIEVSTVQHIPCDWDGVMGVPITFLDKFNPNQFEIIRFRKGNDGRDLSVKGKDKYFRILIKRKVINNESSNNG